MFVGEGVDLSIYFVSDEMLAGNSQQLYCPSSTKRIHLHIQFFVRRPDS